MTDLLPSFLPGSFQQWGPVMQAVTLGLATFVQEDVPTAGAAVLVAAGRLSLPAGFLGCFLGIWIGDALLYLVARVAGRPMLRHAWTRRFLDPAAITRSEQGFARRGTWLLLGSRFVPGTRLPTYLAAGFLGLPFGRFLLVTGCAVAVWTVGLFALAGVLGEKLRAQLGTWGREGLLLAAAVVALVLVSRGIQASLNPGFRRRVRTWLERWTRWEFWPAWLFYAPVVLNYIRLGIRHRGFTVPTAANPGIFSGGIVGESKLATLMDLQATSPEFTVETHGIQGETPAVRMACLEELLERQRIDYPFILKPDVGQRGVGVKLIRSRDQAIDYLGTMSSGILLQRYAPGPCEVGVFYHRLPGEATGRILAITEKVFPTVTGDGHRTLEELIWQDDRARFMANTYLQRLGPRREEVPAAGEEIRLVEAGNHAQGCIFKDGLHLGSEALTERIDEISRKLDGFFVGRYDIRYASAEDLQAGRNFQILELNGAASEATSIYDARNPLTEAYRMLFRQWEIVFAIGAANRRLGVAPTPVRLLWRAWRSTAATIAGYPRAD